MAFGPTLALLALVAPLAALAQLPPPTPRESPHIGGVRLGMDSLGRTLLCLQLNERHKTLELVEPVRVECDGKEADTVVITVDEAPDPQTLCHLALTPLSVVMTELKSVVIRRSEPMQAPIDLLAKLEPWGVRTFAGFLDASGFERIVMKGAGKSVERQIYELSSCSEIAPRAADGKSAPRDAE